MLKLAETCRSAAGAAVLSRFSAAARTWGFNSAAAVVGVTERTCLLTPTMPGTTRLGPRDARMQQVLATDGLISLAP